MDQNYLHQTNAAYWDANGNEELGAIVLPCYGAYVSEDTCRLLGDLSGKRVLELGCGNGGSLEYLAERGASELWGMDLSEKQLERAKRRLQDRGISAKLICSPMEEDCGIPEGYFDLVCSIYAIGWATDLDAVFRRVFSYLKKGGAYVFSWTHPIHKCMGKDGEGYRLERSYFDEEWYPVPLSHSEDTLLLSNRKLSAYVNGLSKAGFFLEKLVEQTDKELLPREGEENELARRAALFPVTFVMKARKL